MSSELDGNTATVWTHDSKVRVHFLMHMCVRVRG
jgi:hypothetical protein